MGHIGPHMGEKNDAVHKTLLFYPADIISAGKGMMSSSKE